MNRRSFIRGAVLVPAAAAAPATAAVIAVSVSAMPERAPLRGKVASPFVGGNPMDATVMVINSAFIGAGAASFASSHMERRPDGSYVPIFEKI